MSGSPTKLPSSNTSRMCPSGPASTRLAFFPMDKLGASRGALERQERQEEAGKIRKRGVAERPHVPHVKASGLVGLVGLAITVCAAERKHEWLAGKVLGAEVTEQFMGYVTSVPPEKSPFPASSVPVWRNTRHYLLATDKMLYLCGERGTKLNLWTGLQTARTLLIEGTVVRFYVEGSDLVVIDNSGHARREVLERESPNTGELQEHGPLRETRGRPPLSANPIGLARGSSKHTIQDVSAEGALVLLDDDSAWKIDELSRMQVGLWLAYSSVTILANADGTYTLVHLTDGETAKARKIE